MAGRFERLRIPTHSALLAVVAAAALIAAVGSLEVSTPPPSSAQLAEPARIVRPRGGIFNIDHFVFVVQENRSFDHYFGTFPGANGIPVQRDGSFARCLPDPKVDHCWRPFHDRGPFDEGGPHNRRASRIDVDGGTMDGFVRSLRVMRRPCDLHADDPHCARVAKDAPSGEPDVMGFHTGKEIPNYWAYAKHYLLQDRMFAPTDSWTMPSHLYMVSGWSALCSDLSTPDPDATSCRTDLEKPSQDWDPWLSASKRPYRWADITWLLHNHGVSWGYFVGPNTCFEPGCTFTTKHATAFGKSPLQGFRTVAFDGQLNRVRPYAPFFAAAEAGTLPSVSWVVPYNENSEHPTHSIEPGQAWVTKVVNAIMRGPRRQWMHTAIFLTWDDWGGFYDHVPPKRIDPYGYGIRVPSIVISPWVKRGLNVDHQTLSFDAYLKLIEDRFLGGARLNGKNEGWPDPRPTIRENKVPGDLRTIFSFTQTPIPRLILDRWP
jgi:phospholipase C